MATQDQAKIYVFVTYFLAGYAVIGLLVGISYWWLATAELSLLLYFTAYVFIPTILVMMRVNNKQYWDWLTLGYLALLVLRYVGPDAYWTWYPPITISLPVTSFTSGSGFLIDVIPLTLLAILLYQKAR